MKNVFLWTMGICCFLAVSALQAKSPINVKKEQSRLINALKKGGSSGQGYFRQVKFDAFKAANGQMTKSTKIREMIWASPKGQHKIAEALSGTFQNKDAQVRRAVYSELMSINLGALANSKSGKRIIAKIRSYATSASRREKDAYAKSQLTRIIKMYGPTLEEAITRGDYKTIANMHMSAFYRYNRGMKRTKISEMIGDKRKGPRAYLTLLKAAVLKNGNTGTQRAILSELYHQLNTLLNHMKNPRAKKSLASMVKKLAAAPKDRHTGQQLKKILDILNPKPSTVKLADGTEVLILGKRPKYSSRYNYFNIGVLGKSVTVKVGNNSFPLKKGRPIEHHFKYGFISAGILEKTVPFTAGKTQLALKKDTQVRFLGYRKKVYLYSAYLAKPATIMVGKDKLIAGPGKSKSYGDISFNSRGDVTSIFPLKPVTIKINGVKYTFKKGQRLSIYNNRVTSGELAKSVKIKVGNHSIIAKGRISFSVSRRSRGAVNTIQVAAQTVTVGGQKIPLKDKSFVGFYPDGKIKYAYIGKSCKLKYRGKDVNVKVSKYGRKYVHFDTKGVISRL